MLFVIVIVGHDTGDDDKSRNAHNAYKNVNTHGLNKALVGSRQQIGHMADEKKLIC